MGLGRLGHVRQILLAKSGPPHPGRDQSGPYAPGIASLAVFGYFANSVWLFVKFRAKEW